MSVARKGRGAALAAALVFAILWAGSVYWLFAAGNEDWFTGVLVMAVFGLGLSSLAWLLTRGADAPPIEVKRPAVEGGAAILYLTLYAVLFTGYAMNWARGALPEGQQQDLLVMGVKLVAHIALPSLLLLALGARIAPLLQAGLSGRKFWRTLIVLGVIVLGLLCVISPSLRNIAETNASAATLAWVTPASFAWIAIEAGLNEEFLFRGVVQTRLSAWFNSAWAGVFVTSLLFGVVHAPGLFMRGAGADGSSADVLQVIAYTIAVLAPMGLLFGLIYARTKSLSRGRSAEHGRVHPDLDLIVSNGRPIKNRRGLCPRRFLSSFAVAYGAAAPWLICVIGTPLSVGVAAASAVWMTPVTRSRVVGLRMRRPRPKYCATSITRGVSRTPGSGTSA
jgi:uncharacterized protein